VSLFNVQADLEEREDLAELMPHKVGELREKLEMWRQSVGAQMPLLNPEYKQAENGQRATLFMVEQDSILRRF
ncbi:hypothetical protein MYX75_10675, partial [Acidobacteria bacterium AH-259-A15]|nr:hypothetical protein [Acidobacteria bacterium AH-259-A15]